MTPALSPQTGLIWEQLSKSTILIHSVLYKVNRCLARYSPRATTTNQPTNRAPNEPARPGPCDQKCQFRAKFGHFGAKNPNFYWRKQKFWYPHNRYLQNRFLPYDLKFGRFWAKHPNFYWRKQKFWNPHNGQTT